MSKAKPFIKWVGGKRQLLPNIINNMPLEFNNYYEPFMGGGALFFHLNHNKSFLNDINEELVNLYKVVKEDVELLIEDLKKHKNTKEYFYKIRNQDREEVYEKMSTIEKASRFIYLNKTCFNGLYRVNKKGQFNTPFGSYNNPKIVDSENLRLASESLKYTIISQGSFHLLEDKIKKNDFIYLDPPYAPLSATSNFTSYTKENFDLKMQEELRDFCDRIHKKGAYFLLSNSSAPLIYDLYKNYDIEEVLASRNINSKGDSRGKIKELLVKNY